MREYHEKSNSLNNLKPRTKDTEKLKQEVLNNFGDICNELYDTYKSEYNKKIDILNAKNKKKFDYKKLRLSDNYQYSSEEEQEEKQEKQEEEQEKQEEEQEKQDEKTIYVNKFNESIIKEETDINKELFKNHFFFQTPSALLKNLYKTNDKEKNGTFIGVVNSGLKDLKKR